jgi:hypothetical protein
MATRIPQSDGPFNDYLNLTANVLLDGTPNTGTRLGLTGTQMTDWEDYRVAWNANYESYTDPARRTKSVTNIKNTNRQKFIAFASPLLTAFSVHPALTENDRATFRLPAPDKIPTERVKIDGVPVAELIPVVGAEIKIRVRTSTDSTRASRHPMADHVEMRYAVVAVGDAPPATAADCNLSAISTKAIFSVQVGQEHSGKRVYAFFRWVNASNAALNGNWGMIMHTVVV